MVMKLLRYDTNISILIEASGISKPPLGVVYDFYHYNITLDKNPHKKIMIRNLQKTLI